MSNIEELRALLALLPGGGRVTTMPNAKVHASEDRPWVTWVPAADYELLQLWVRAALAAEPEPGLDVERARLVFHNEYNTSDHDCRHRNQHRSTWDCTRRVDEFAAEYTALTASKP